MNSIVGNLDIIKNNITISHVDDIGLKRFLSEEEAVKEKMDAKMDVLPVMDVTNLNLSEEEKWFEIGNWYLQNRSLDRERKKMKREKEDEEEKEKKRIEVVEFINVDFIVKEKEENGEKERQEREENVGNGFIDLVEEEEHEEREDQQEERRRKRQKRQKRRSLDGNENEGNEGPRRRSTRIQQLSNLQMIDVEERRERSFAFWQAVMNLRRSNFSHVSASIDDAMDLYMNMQMRTLSTSEDRRDKRNSEKIKNVLMKVHSDPIKMDVLSNLVESRVSWVSRKALDLKPELGPKLVSGDCGDCEVCSICMYGDTESDDCESDDSCRKTHCGHSIHLECLVDHMLVNALQDRDILNCPLCRACLLEPTVPISTISTMEIGNQGNYDDVWDQLRYICQS